MVFSFTLELQLPAGFGDCGWIVNTAFILLHPHAYQSNLGTGVRFRGRDRCREGDGPKVHDTPTVDGG